MIDAQTFTQLLHVSARKQLCKRLYDCTVVRINYKALHVSATCVIYVYVSIKCLLNRYLSSINNKAQYVVFSNS